MADNCRVPQKMSLERLDRESLTLCRTEWKLKIIKPETVTRDLCPSTPYKYCHRARHLAPTIITSASDDRERCAMKESHRHARALIISSKQITRVR